jgi:polysaccharide export outer membrane protein
MTANVRNQKTCPRAGARGSIRRGLACALAATLALGCTQVGHFVWVDGYKDAASAAGANPYVLSRGDVISIRVWNQEAVSGRVRIRNDGMISLPFVNDVEAAGLKPADLAKRLQVKLKDFVVNPVVVVSVEEPAPVEISVVGEVARPGVYRIDAETGVLKVLATAGGLTPLADRDMIFVLRPGAVGTGGVTRIRFKYETLARAEGPAARFLLRSGDTVVVE